MIHHRVRERKRFEEEQRGKGSHHRNQRRDSPSGEERRGEGSLPEEGIHSAAGGNLAEGIHLISFFVCFFDSMKQSGFLLNPASSKNLKKKKKRKRRKEKEEEERKKKKARRKEFSPCCC